MEYIDNAADTLEELANQPPEELARKLADATEKTGGRTERVNLFSVVDIEFVRPLEWCGKTYKAAHLDFGALTGLDMEAIDEEMESQSNASAFPALNREYQKRLAAKAAKIPSDVIGHLSAADYHAMVSAAQRFLMASG